MEFINWLFWFLVGNTAMLLFIICLCTCIFGTWFIVPKAFRMLKRSSVYHKFYNYFKR